MDDKENRSVVVRSGKGKEKAAKKDPEMSEAWWGIAKTFSAQSGRPCAAMYLPLMRCIALDPKNATTYERLKWCLRDRIRNVTLKASYDVDGCTKDVIAPRDADSRDA